MKLVNAVRIPSNHVAIIEVKIEELNCDDEYTDVIEPKNGVSAHREREPIKGTH